MNSNRKTYSILWFILLLCFAGILFYALRNQNSFQDNSPGITSSKAPVPDTGVVSKKEMLTDSVPGKIPSYVLQVLDHIQKNNSSPKGYVGGRRFENREKLLPINDHATGKKIQYREWDVHPKHKGKNRGAERLVTGSNGFAYYTSDHYKTFLKIK